MAPSHQLAIPGENAGRVKSFNHLQRERYVLLTTFRKDGRGVPTAIWPIFRDGVIMMTTGGKTGKVKRIRNNARVTIAPCDPSGKHVTGPTYEAWARILSDEETREVAAERRRQYGLMDRVVKLALFLTGHRKQVGLAFSATPEGEATSI